MSNRGRRVPTESVNYERLHAALQKKGWQHTELVAACAALAKGRGIPWPKASDNNKQWLERLLYGNGLKTVDVADLELAANALGLRLDDVVANPNAKLEALGQSGELKEITDTCLAAAAAAALRLRDVLERPYLAGAVRTSPMKISSREPERDPTEAVDQATSEAILTVLEKSALQPGHPLSKGYTVLDEERGLMRRGSTTSDLYMFIDSCDDTRLAKRGLGGTCLVSAYFCGVGWLAVGAADPMRHRVYFRQAGRPSHSMRVRSFEGDFMRGGPEGQIQDLPCSGRKTVAGMCLNVYTGTAERLSMASDLLRPLLEAMGHGDLLSEGGSRGLILVCEGLADSAVEIAKGYRPLDLMPGAFLSEGAGLACKNLDGTPLRFGPDKELEAALQRMGGAHGDTERGASVELDRLRRRFIIAATEELAAEIVDLIARPAGRPRPTKTDSPTGLTQRRGTRERSEEKNVSGT